MKKLSDGIALSIAGPLIYEGDDIVKMSVDSILQALDRHGITPHPEDKFAITESVLAIAQGNMISHGDLEQSFAERFAGKTIGVVDPIRSKNRFLYCLPALSKIAKEVFVLFRPEDEQGNKFSPHTFDPYKIDGRLYANKEDYIKEYGPLGVSSGQTFDHWDRIESLGGDRKNVHMLISQDASHITKFSDHILAASVHGREKLKHLVLSNGASTAYTLDDFMREPIAPGGGYNPEFGMLGANRFGDNRIKLLARDCEQFVRAVQEEFARRTGVSPLGLVFGDGAIKDPNSCWELADPGEGYYGASPELLDKDREGKLKHDMALLLEQGYSKEEVENMLADREVDGFGSSTTPKTRGIHIANIADSMAGSGDRQRWGFYMTDVERK